MRKQFLTDGNCWFAVDVDRRGFFNTLNSRKACSLETQDLFEEEFGDDRLVEDISDYSFEDVRLEYDEN